MNSVFSNLGISPPILKAIEDMGFESPTEVQSQAIPHVLNREDVIVMFKTGSGKTAVYGVPLLQMTDPGAAGPQGLILTPTRELAVQVDNDLRRMARYLPHQTASVYGQHSMKVEIQALKRGVSIVTGTPGRVYDHISHGNLKTRHIRFLVLDEADRMLDMGFFYQVVRIIKTLPTNRVTLVFSATIPPEVRKICLNHMKNPVTIEIESETKTVDTTQQIYYRVRENEKNAHLNRLLLLEQPESCLIFCNKRNTVNKVQSYLDRRGYASGALHGDIPQVKRLKTIQQFKKGNFHILVATDVAARGIHIDDLSLVINYDLPFEKDAYIHRIGRTGRAGNGGRAITMITDDEIISLYEIEEHIGAMIAEAELPSGAVSDEYKASVEEWLQSNLQKRKMLGVASRSYSAGSQKKRTQSKSPQNRKKQREQSVKPVNRNANPKPVKPVNTTPHAEQNKKPQSIPKPVSSGYVEPKVVHSPTNPESIKRQAAATKKTFFQRVRSHILNRQ